MPSKKRVIADLLFGVQLVCAAVFCGAYFIRSLHDVTGSSIVQFGLVGLFLLVNLGLGIGAHHAAPSRITRQAIFTYGLWLVLIIAIIVAIGTNSMYRWNQKESAQLLTAGVLTIVVLIVSIVQDRKISDPMLKGLLGIAYKSVPQVLLAWNFLSEGASGSPGLSIVFGHVSILIRLGQIYFLVKEAGWDRNRIWLAVSEITNEVSWIVVSVTWIFVL